MLKSSRPMALLLFSIFLSIAAAAYPHLPAVNPNKIMVGVDILNYVEAAEIVDRDISQAFKVSSGYRPIIFLVIYGFQRLLGSDVSTAVKFLPVMLNPLMIMTAFFLAHEAFNDGWIASWAAFFTACGYQVTVGMFSYFLTNMLALSLAFLSLGFLFRFLRRFGKIDLVLSSILGFLLFFTHPWTFYQYLPAMFLTIAISWYRNRDKFPIVTTMFLCVLSLLLVGIFEVLNFRGFRFFPVFSFVLSFSEDLSGFWAGNTFIFRLLFGGLLSYMILLSLALIGIYLMDRKNINELYLTVFLALTSLFFLIGNYTLKSRLFYNVPIGLFASLGFNSIIRLNISEDFKRMLITFVILIFTVYLFRSLANLV